MVLYFGVLYIYYYYKLGINFVIEYFLYIFCNMKIKIFKYRKRKIMILRNSKF